jgi:hypothetical protein
VSEKLPTIKQPLVTRSGEWGGSNEADHDAFRELRLFRLYGNSAAAGDVAECEIIGDAPVLEGVTI